jgi:hypothetical protein
MNRGGSANSDSGIKGDGLAQLGEDFARKRRADHEKTPSQPLRSFQGESRIRCHSRRAAAGLIGHQVRRPSSFLIIAPELSVPIEAVIILTRGGFPHNRSFAYSKADC